MELQTYEGVVLQSRKHYQSHGNGISATLHLEFWLRFDDGREHRVHLTDVDLPIRVSRRQRGNQGEYRTGKSIYWRRPAGGAVRRTD